MSLFYATKFRRQPAARPKRIESIGFAGLAAALATVREMNDVAAEGDLWLVTTKVDGAHVPAVVGSGGGAAVLMRAGCYDLEPAELLAVAAE